HRRQELPDERPTRELTRASSSSPDVRMFTPASFCLPLYLPHFHPADSPTCMAHFTPPIVLHFHATADSDGGRLRLREPKRGPQTKKGRRRFTGAWREPKVLIVYMVDAEGKQETRFAPFIDATLQGPDAVFALLRTSLQRLEITRADHVLLLADGASWIWKRVPLLVQALG